MITLKEIFNKLRNHKQKIEKDFNVKNIAVFGSFVKGNPNKKSDIDLIVEFYKTPDLYLLVDLEEYLQKILRRKVDIVRLSVIRKEIKDRILKEAIFI